MMPFLLEPGTPNQNAYIDASYQRLRHECLNEHRFTNLLHAKLVIEAWRRDDNEQRPKKSWRG